jgi:hypothetical protein
VIYVLAAGGGGTWVSHQSNRVDPSRAFVSGTSDLSVSLAPK